MTVVSGDLQGCHERESEHDGDSSKKSGHPVLVKFVSGKNFEEGYVEKSSGGKTLENTNDEDVLSGSLLQVRGNNEANEDTSRSVDAEDDHEDQDLELLDTAGDHVGADTEDDWSSVNGDGHQQLPHS